MRILIVEDERDSSEILKVFLSSKEHLVKVAGCAQEAIDLSIVFRPELIVSDWNLKDEFDGVEICEYIKQLDENAVVVFVSASADLGLKQAACTLAPLEVLSKPIDLSKLHRVVQKVEAAVTLV